MVSRLGRGQAKSGRRNRGIHRIAIVRVPQRESMTLTVVSLAIRIDHVKFEKVLDVVVKFNKVLMALIV